MSTNNKVLDEIGCGMLKSLVADETILASMYLNYGKAYEKEKHFESALDFYYKVLAILEKLEPSPKLIETYFTIAELFNKKRELEKALLYNNKALDLVQKLEPKGDIAARIYNLTGIIYCAQNKLQEAVTEYEKSLSIIENLGSNSINTAILYENIAQCYIDISNDTLDEALTCFHRSLQIREKISPDSSETAELYKSIGNIYFKQNKVQEAMLQYDKYAEIIEKVKLNEASNNSVESNKQTTEISQRQQISKIFNQFKISTKTKIIILKEVKLS